jgi:hypothetical protein
LDSFFSAQGIQKRPQIGPKSPGIEKKREKVIHGGHGRRWIEADDENSKGEGKRKPTKEKGQQS